MNEVVTFRPINGGGLWPVYPLLPSIRLWPDHGPRNRALPGDGHLPRHRSRRQRAYRASVFGRTTTGVSFHAAWAESWPSVR